jgi:hypothetical protein
MSMTVSLIKIAVLTLALVCVDAVKPTADSGARAVSPRISSVPKPQRLQCRMYFGCLPVAGPLGGVVQL